MIEEKLLISISRLRNLIFRELDVVFRENGLTSTQFAILEVLKHKGPLCVGDIQKLILGTNGTVPLVIKNLERDGYIFREQDKKDKRISIINLTERGKTCIDIVYPKQQEKLKNILKNIEEKDIEETTNNLFKIYSNIKGKEI